MADEQSNTPPVSELAAQLASHIANKPLGPATGQTVQADRPPRENRPPREARPPREGGRPPGQGQGPRPEGDRGPRPARRDGKPEGKPGEGRPSGDRGGDRGGDRDRGPRPGGGRFDFPLDIDLE